MISVTEQLNFHAGSSMHVKDDTLGHPRDFECQTYVFGLFLVSKIIWIRDSSVQKLEQDAFGGRGGLWQFLVMAKNI